MDIKQYLDSGIIESYVLGAASPQEKQEVSCLAAIYPEIKIALSEAQGNLEKYITSIAVTPPPSLKTNIFSAIKNIKQLPADKLNEKTEKKAIVRKVDFTKYGLAASVLIIAGLIYFLNNTSQNLIEKNQALSNKEQEIENLKGVALQNTVSFQDSIRDLADRNNLLLAKETRLVALNGTDVSPDAKVRVFWNKDNNEIVIIQDQLPSPNEKQYQLWAISKGVPVDLGVLSKSGEVVEKRKIELSDIDAFAITLEVDGGAPTPDLTQLFVIGNT